MTNLIDKRVIELNTTFEDLKNGDFFEEDAGTIAIKTGACTAMYYNGSSWIPFRPDKEQLVIPLIATITIEKNN